MRLFQLLVPLLSLALLLSPAADAAGEKNSGKLIKKCQDAAGQWHYGDTADEACAKSKITEISEQGTKKKEIAAPPTEAELKEREHRKDELEQERKLAEEKKRHDDLLLSTYAVEDDILYTRDRKLAQLESTIKASEETLKSLRAALARLESQAAEESRSGKPASASTTRSIAQTKSQIATHEAAVQAKREEQEAVRKQAAADLERYRELKKGQPARDGKK